MMQQVCGIPLEPEHGQAAAQACHPAPGTAPCRIAGPGMLPLVDCQQTPALGPSLIKL